MKSLKKRAGRGGIVAYREVDGELDLHLASRETRLAPLAEQQVVIAEE